ncbi:MAG: sigma factor-like helix-turn-helix DNA-binding protein [Clostridiaceae bacterium]
MELVKIAYRFADGHVEELKVEKEVAETLRELDRQEYNNNHRETRRHVTFDCTEEKSWLAVDDQRLSRLLDGPPDEIRLRVAINQLEQHHRDLIIAIFYRGIKIVEYAKLTGVSQSAISQQLGIAIKKLKKLLE